jgi:acetyl esterase/lipase
VSRARLISYLLARPRRFRYGPHRSQRADLHLPRTPGPHPVVVLIHGGSWQDHYGKVVTRALAADLAGHGWAVWNIEYRRVGDDRAGGGWPATFEDVAAAIDRLADVAPAANLSLDRAIAVGHSAGGHLALWAAGRDALPDHAPGARPLVTMRAAVSLAGVNDLGGAYEACPPDGRSVGALMGGGPRDLPEAYALADPIRQVPLAVPVLLVHGTEDETVSVARSRDYAAAATAAGGDVRLIEIAGASGGHRRFINPRGEGWVAARAWLAEWRGARSAGSPARSAAG